MLYDKAFILDNNHFEELRDNVNLLGKNIDFIWNIFQKISDHSQKEQKLELTKEELSDLQDFWDLIIDSHYRLLKDIYTGIDEEDNNKRYFPKYAL